MRTRILGLGLGLALSMAMASGALAATGGGTDDLGLDALQVTSGTAGSASGSVILTGSISCSQDVNVYVYAQLTQVVGRFNTLRGWGQTTDAVPCTAAVGTAQLQLSVSPESGKFAGGSAVVEAGAEAGLCDDFGCMIDEAHYGPAALKLKGGKG